MEPALWVWGVDTGASKASICAYREGELPRFRTEVVREPFGTVRLHSLAGVVGDAVIELAQACPPRWVWVERPSGNFVNPNLMAGWGVVLAALGNLEPGTAAVVPDLSSTAWKKAELDESALPPVLYRELALELLDHDVTEDEAAAFWIARYGWSRVT